MLEEEEKYFVVLNHRDMEARRLAVFYNSTGMPASCISVI
jgi:hypothetical protein